MKIAIVIGSYRLKEFVHLNICQCRAIFGDVSILIADDKSESTPEIEQIAARYDCHFISSTARRGHFAADVQSVILGLGYAEQEKADIIIKLSQRLVPAQPVFKDYIAGPFDDPKINIVLPSRIHGYQIASAQSKFFQSFGVLTDCLAIRVGSISPKELKEQYESNYKHGRYSSFLLAEVFFGKLISTHFVGASFISEKLANHDPGTVMGWVRKCQATSNTYKQLAAFHGITGEFTTMEWGAYEARNYLSRPVF